VTNLEKWRFGHKHVTSPASWVDAAWLFCVSSALQRRVWYRSLDADALFTNMYFVLIGPPAAGKGLAMSQVKRTLFQPQDVAQAAAAEKTGAEVPMLIHAGPDSGSFQGLMDCMAKATSGCRFPAGVAGPAPRAYSHASVALVLTEMNSLFQKNKDDVAKFLLKTYDCEDFKYHIVSRCKDMLVKHTCLSILAGCTSHMLEEAARYGIFDSGFTSRCVWLFEPGPRYYTLDLPEMTAEQMTAIAELQPWIRRLAGIKGQLTVGPGVAEFLASKNAEHERKMRTSSAKMQLYLGRNGVLIRKLAAAFHFSDSLEMTVPLSCFEQAWEWLQPIERKMAAGFSVTGKNELNHVAQAIIARIGGATGPLTDAALFASVMHDCGYNDYLSVRQGLEVAGLIRQLDGSMFELVT
jgi:hypothetical protein